MHCIGKLARRAALVLAMSLGAIGIAIGGGGATGTGYTADGMLTAFGSIFVNGIEFFTTSAAISVNGVPNRSQSDLKLGMVLTVNGSLDGSGKTGNAYTVVYQADAIGAVDRALDGSGTISVLGQAVSADARTVFAGFLALGDLQPGDNVEVSGYRSPSGILAGRIEKLGSIPGVQVRGTIGSVAATTFTLGTLTVDYGAATLKNVPSSGFAAGQQVVAKGPAPSAGVLAATEVEVLQQDLSGTSNGSTSGLIASLPPSALVVSGQTYVLTSSTQYVNGDASGLAPGVLVKVDFNVIASTPVATKVEFQQLDETAGIAADVTSRTATTLELLGPDGVTVTVNAATQYKDSSGGSGGGGSFGLASINAGDRLEVRGHQVSTATVLADRIERTKASSAIDLEGLALSVAAPTFAVLDEVIAVDGASDLRDENGVPISQDIFFAMAAGHDVAVNAVLRSDGTLYALSARLDP